MGGPTAIHSANGFRAGARKVSGRRAWSTKITNLKNSKTYDTQDLFTSHTGGNRAKRGRHSLHRLRAKQFAATRSTAGAIGHGMFEHMNLGPYRRYGFKDFLDGAP